MLAFSQAAFSAFTFVLAALGSDASCSAGISQQSECGQQLGDGLLSSEANQPNDEAVEVPSLMQMSAVGGEHGSFERGEDIVEVIVEIKDAVGQRAVNGFQAPGTSGIFLNGKHSLEAINMSKKDLDALVKSSGVQAVEEVASVKPLVITPHPEAIFESLGAETVPYGIVMVQADVLDQGPHPVKVCVVDTGYGLGHPDLPTENVTGTDTSSGKWDVDGHGHGTHCAGSIGAIGGNDIGVTSVNPDPTKFTFHIGKGLSDSGGGSTTSVLAAVQGCAAAGAKVISMSLGGGGWGQVSHDTYKTLYEDEGILIVAAAGNDGNDAYSYPASYPHVMSVAAVNSQEAKAGFSQWNDQVEIAGPGVSVNSPITLSSGSQFSYASWSGTSMACPHVAGVAALVWSHFPACSNSQIRRVLTLTAKDKGESGCDVEYGWGIVQAKAAYDLLATGGCEAGGPSMPPSTYGGCKFFGQPTPAPTPTPTFPPDCSNTLTVKVVTDNYPAENEWSVKDSEGRLVTSGGPYSTPNSENTAKTCLVTGLYRFTITDSYKDGMCCNYGNGSYSVTFNGQVVASGGEFEDAEYADINVPPQTPSPPPTPVPTPDPATTTKVTTSMASTTEMTTAVTTTAEVCDLQPVATGFYCHGTKYMYLGEGMDPCACNQKQRDTCGCSKKSFHWYKTPSFGKGHRACWCPTDVTKDVDAEGICQGGTTGKPSSGEIYYVQNAVCDLEPITSGFFCKGTPFEYLGDGMDACSCNLKQQQHGACSKRSFHVYSAPAFGKGAGGCWCPTDATKDVNAAGLCQGGTTRMTSSPAHEIYYINQQ